jgi:transporter family protein
MEPWMVYAFLAALFAAAVAILGKLGVEGVDPTAATAVRSVVMTVFLAGVTIVLGKTTLLRQVSGRVLLYVVLSGVAGALSWLFYFWALKSGPASAVAAIDRSSVVLVLLMAVLFLAEPWSWRTAAGAILVATGAMLISIR